MIVSSDTRAGRAGMRWCGMANQQVGRLGAVEWARKVARCLTIKPDEDWYKGMIP